MILQGDLQGHWRRDWIKAPGFEDRTTRVHWLQAGSLFADLRVPLKRPHIKGRTALSDFTQAELAQLLSAEGFAGEISVADSCCTWHREINWHGLPSGEDIGRMSFEDGALIEDGVHATYKERWLKVASAPLRGWRISANDEIGILIESEHVFLFGIGTPPEANSSELIKALSDGKASTGQLQKHFESQFCFGTWTEDVGIANLSTNPFCEGQQVIKRGGELAITQTSFDGEVRTHDFSQI